MEKKIIALRGKANVGKTSTLKKAYEILKNNYTIENVFKRIDAEIKVIVIIKGVKIGIESQGDPGYRLKESLKEFAEKECVIIICATRTRGQTVKAVEEQKPIYKVIWKEQKENKLAQAATNDAMAKKIIQEIEKAWS